MSRPGTAIAPLQPLAPCSSSGLLYGVLDGLHASGS